MLEQTFTPGSPTINTYTTGAFETDTNWYLLNENQVKISLSQSFYYGEFISTGSYSGLDSFVFPFSLNNNDLVRFYNVSTSLWNEAGEFIIKDIDTSYSDSTGSFVVLTLNRKVDPEFTSGGSVYPSAINKYLVLKKLKDETSIYFNYNLPQPIPQDGTLFPQYIGEGIKEASGNVIKSLKQQNLI